MKLLSAIIFALVVSLLSTACTFYKVKVHEHEYNIPISRLHETMESARMDVVFEVATKSSEARIRLNRLKGFESKDILLSLDSNGQEVKIAIDDVKEAWYIYYTPDSKNGIFSPELSDSSSFTNNDSNAESSDELPTVDKTILLGDIVLLDGRQVYDSGAGEISYQWTIKSKPADSLAELDYPTSFHPSFYADTEGHYVIELIGTDEFGVAKPPATLTIGTSPPYWNTSAILYDLTFIMVKLGVLLAVFALL